MSGPSTLLVGAFEADVWAGLVVAADAGLGGALRLGVEIGGHRVEPADLFFLVHEVGPHAPDAGYARAAFDLSLPLPASNDTPIRPVEEGEASLTWEWARLGDEQVVCRAAVARAMRVWLEAGAPWDWPGEWAVDGRALTGRLTAAGAAHLTFTRISDASLSAVETDADRRAVRVAIEMPARGELLVVASLDRGAGAPELPSIEAARAQLVRAADRYTRTRVAVDGDWRGLAASVTNNVHWMVLLQPERQRRYVPAGRRWLFPAPDGTRDHWTVFEWDGFFNALLLSLESPALAGDMLEALFDTAYPSGVLPNWRSRLAGTPDRSQPPIGAFVVAKIVLRTGRHELLARALPVLDAWHAWWRAPVRGGQRRQRPSGLYAWGSDLDQLPPWVPPWEQTSTAHQKAAWESGQDDLPNWDDAAWDDRGFGFAMDCVDLSAFMALDAECLAWLHERHGDAGRAEAYRLEHRQLAALIDSRSWDAARGVFADGFDDGRFSPRVAASNFLPLLAGAGSSGRGDRALGVLTDPSRFWGRWIVPTISRDDPAFADQQYWRGTIWPPMNYLLYEAVRRLGRDDLAADLAARSVALFLDDWHRHQVCRENFSSLDGSGGGQRHQSWGPLFSWTGLAEFADATPWDGLRFGTTVVTSSSTVRRLALAGRVWDIALAPDGLRVWCDGGSWLTADHPVCLRHVERTGRGWHAEITATRETRLVLSGTERRVASGTTRVEWVDEP